jgi:glucan phosphoethanolaminetransferase (alkaline phosphatase superfamily)
MYYRDSFFDFSESQVWHILISVTTLSGVLAFGLKVPLAYPVFYFSLIAWVVIVGALILKGALEISTSPYRYLGLATILLVITFKTFLLGLALAVVFVVMVQQINNKLNEKQLKANIKRNEKLGPVAANRDPYVPKKINTLAG